MNPFTPVAHHHFEKNGPPDGPVYTDNDGGTTGFDTQSWTVPLGSPHPRRRIIAAVAYKCSNANPDHDWQLGSVTGSNTDKTHPQFEDAGFIVQNTIGPDAAMAFAVFHYPDGATATLEVTPQSFVENLDVCVWRVIMDSGETRYDDDGNNGSGSLSLDIPAKGFALIIGAADGFTDPYITTSGVVEDHDGGVSVFGRWVSTGAETKSFNVTNLGSGGVRRGISWSTA